MWEMQIQANGIWVSLKPLMPALAPAYRYNFKVDAEKMLDSLFPKLPKEYKRVIDAMSYTCKS